MSAATVTLDPLGCALNGIPLYSLKLTAETEVVESLSPAPDPLWTFTDAKGHFHAWSPDHIGRPALPSLKVVDELVPCDGACGFDGGCEGYTRRHYTCMVCAEPVEPGRIPGPHRSPGDTFYAARVSGPGELLDVLAPGDMVCLTYPGGFDYGLPGDCEVTMSSDVMVVEVSISIRSHNTRMRSGYPDEGPGESPRCRCQFVQNPPCANCEDGLVDPDNPRGDLR